QDLRVLGQLAALYERTDPVPAGLVERIRFGITLDALHAEIAELQRTDDLTGVRSGELTEAQTVTFTSASLTTMITITPTLPGRARIDGWAEPGGGLLIELRVVADQMHTTADSDGRFAFEDVPRGLAQFVLRPPAGTAQPDVVTPSIEL
ncbi:MAG: carboxypeptidase regulatory-like domain-containing protein, partial [Jatrophihabitans sp.]